MLKKIKKSPAKKNLKEDQFVGDIEPTEETPVSEESVNAPVSYPKPYWAEESYWNSLSDEEKAEKLKH